MASILPVLLPTLGLVRVPARANAAAGRAGVLLGIPDVPYADSYKQAELSALWGALKKCYGSEAAAREAIARNNQIMCPVYATPALLTETKAALVALVGRDEALEIMAMNPAVLTCGAKELAAADPAEVRSAAKTRQLLDRFVTPEGLTVAVVIVLLLGVVRLASAPPV